MRRTRGGSERSGEMVFADVAMAALGPIALLMVLFMLAAGQKALSPGCTPLDSEAFAERALRLAGWLERTRDEIEIRFADMEAHCPQAMFNREEVARADLLPEFLSTTCLDDREQLLRRNGIDLKALQQLIGLRERTLLALDGCARREGTIPCMQPEESQRQAQVTRFKEWVAALDYEIRDSAEQLRHACDVEQPYALGTGAEQPPLLPSGSERLCIDQATLLRNAGITRETLAHKQALRDAMIRELRHCAGKLYQSQEKPESKRRQIEFKTCTTTFIEENGATMSRERVARFFAILAAEVEKDIARSPLINRIDIFGHTDERPVGRAGCRNGAKDNRTLSALRAIRFADELERAMRQRSDRLARRLDEDDLRLYGIGVGAQEPEISGARTAWQHRQNRRIVIRYVVDPFGRAP